MATQLIFNQYAINTLNLSTISANQAGNINTLNAYSFVIAQNNPMFRESLVNSDILLPDGFPVVLATRLLTGKKIQKIAGGDIHFHLLNKANQQGLKVMYLGSTEGTLQKIKEKLSVEYPQIKAITCSPPFKTQFTQDDNDKMVEFVNMHKPDILFVGMTAPKQEIWAYQHKNKLNVPVICCIGAVFDFYAGTVKRAPAFMINLRLEWFYRLIKEPRRMWRRYLIYSPLFFWYLLLALLKPKKSF